eukprot:3576841-Amphidinium_carterae.1
MEVASTHKGKAVKQKIREIEDRVCMDWSDMPEQVHRVCSNTSLECCHYHLKSKCHTSNTSAFRKHTKALPPVLCVQLSTRCSSKGNVL